VTTTERLSPSLPKAWLPAMRDNQRANLRTLLQAGVKVAIGSDAISGERRFVTARDEVRFLDRHRLMTPAQILHAWSVDTPKTIFPARNVGELREGFEASFLVLDDDPRDNPENLHRIVRRVQLGRELPPLPSFRLVR
jgi:imidazolonepropionase-like amidohydrolase